MKMDMSILLMLSLILSNMNNSMSNVIMVMMDLLTFKKSENVSGKWKLNIDGIIVQSDILNLPVKHLQDVMKIVSK
jgi:hypothetical protein